MIRFIMSKWTNVKLFNQIIKILKDRYDLPNILDYYLPSRIEVEITTYEVHCIGSLTFGGSEGIYIDVYLEGKNTIKLGTFKTLKENKPAWDTMALLMGNFQYETNKFIDSHIREFE